MNLGNRPLLNIGTKAPTALITKVTDDLVPEELERKKKRNELNESTYYSIRGTH